MRRALILCCLAAGCGLPDVDTPASRSDVAAPYPNLVPRHELLSATKEDRTAPARLELSERGGALSDRGTASLGARPTADPGAILQRADDLRSRAQDVRNAAAPSGTSAEALRERAATIRSDRDAARPEPAQTEDSEDAERLRRLRLLQEGTGADPL